MGSKTHGMINTLHTPGPWRWEVNESTKDIQLCGGVPLFDKTVMSFSRCGMQGAVPEFRHLPQDGDDFQGMVKATNYSVIVKGREHHANWFKTIRHPDALLMQAAPELMDACIKVYESMEDKESLSGLILLRAIQIARGIIPPNPKR